jgi:tetratricopeptide (TPR) repeat protein
MVSLGFRYWILMKRIGILIWLAFLFVACDTNVDSKGEDLPPAEAYLAKQDPIKVISFTSQLLEDQPNSTLFYLRAKAYFDLHAYQKAYFDINKAIENNPRDLEYLGLSAKIKLNLELYQEALKDAQLVESAKKENLEIFELLTQIHLFLHQPALVRFYVRKAQKLNLPTSSYANLQAYSRLSQLDSLTFSKRYFSLISPSEKQDPMLDRLSIESKFHTMPAIQFQTLLLGQMKKYPLDPHLLRIWARFLGRLGKNALAEQVYKKVDEQFVDNFPLKIEWAQWYVKVRNYPNALRVLAEIPSNSLIYKEVLWQKSMIYGYMGNKSANLAVLDSGIKLFVKDTRFIGAKDRLTGKIVDSLQIPVDSILNVGREF